MQGKDFLYFLVDELGRSYYVEQGIVKRSAVPRPLENTPEGWLSIEIDNIRNQKYFALDRSFSIPLHFVGDGGFILKDAYYKQGIEAKIFLVITKQKLFYDSLEYGWYYAGLYRGEIDFSTFIDSGSKVTANIMEGGPVKYIKANENVTFEFDVDVPEARKIKMDGVTLQQSASFLITNGALLNDLGAHVVETLLLGTESVQSLGAKSTTRTVVADNTQIFATGQNFLTTGSSGTALTIVYDFGILLQLAEGFGGVPGTHYFFQLRGFNEAGVEVLVENIVDHNPGDPLLLYRHHRFSGTFTTTIPANTTLFLDSVTSQQFNVTFFTYDNDGTLDASYTYRHPTTYVKALPASYLYKKLIEKVTNGKYTAQSDVLLEFDNILVTSGDAIRSIEGSKIKTTLFNFFQSYNVQLSLGMGEIMSVVRLERKSFWVDYSDPIDLGEVSELVVKPATEYMFNRLRVGYQAKEYEDVNGRQEFNNTNQYTSPLTRISKELDLICPYRADCYGIEFIRINLEGKKTTDDSGDNDVFMIHVNSAPIVDPVEGDVYELNRDLNPFATGLLEPSSVFNIFLSPRRCLDRNGAYIRSCFYKMDAGSLTWQTTDKNRDLATTSPVVVEKANVVIGTLADPLFTANILEFKCPAPVDLVETLAFAPVRAFKGTYLGVAFMGIAVKVGIRDADFEPQNYQLLSAPTNDLEQLIPLTE